MRKILLSVCFTCGLLFLNISPVQALAIDLLPQYQEANVNAPVNVDIVISGLGDSTAPSLSTYDISIYFDPAMLSLIGVSFGDQLDLFGLGSIQIVDDSVSGIANLYELSLDLPDDLNVLQLPSFTLATLTFETLLAGLSSVDVEALYLGDAYGDPLTLDDINGAQINAIPIPGTIWLFCSGLACLISMFRVDKGLE
jgi:hypothetical protein